MLPKVLAGCLIGAFVTLLLPRETVSHWVGAESALRGILIATVAGAILPGGPFTIYPVAGAFLAAGADAGAACAFVISWTLLGWYTRHRLGATVLRARLRDVARHRLAAAADPRRNRRPRYGWKLRAPARPRHEPHHRHRAVAIVVIALGDHGVRAPPSGVRRDDVFGGHDFLALLPRIAIGMIGSGFIAEILPSKLIPSWLGADSGFAGSCDCDRSAERLTPGGPVVGFAIATAALKSGAGAPQVIAYSVAWALFALQRVIVFEIPMMPAKRRVAACCGLAAAAVSRRVGRDGDRHTPPPPHRRCKKANASPTVRGMIAPRWRITWLGQAVRGLSRPAPGPRR